MALLKWLCSAVWLICMTSLLHLVLSDDIYFTDTENQYKYVSEDAGTILISITSRATEEREAFFDFYYYYYQYRNYAIPGVDLHFQNITYKTQYFNFTISAGSTRTFPLTIIDDSVAEYYYERLHYGIGIYDSGQRLYCDYGYIIIDDNDGLRFEQIVVFVDEDVGTVELCVSYRGSNVPPTIDANIYYRDYDDYDNILFTETNFTISNGNRICFDVIIIDDDAIECTEYYGFKLRFQNETYHDHFRDYMNFIVTDNEAFRFGFEQSSYSVIESDGEVSVCVTGDRGDGSDVYRLVLRSNDGTSQGEADYGFLQQHLIISANLTRQCVTINITNDNETEENEFFRIFIWLHTNVSSSTNIYHLHTQSATVTIIDDDLICSPTCVNGVCVYPGVCLCDEGWIDEDCSREICQAPCVNGTCDVNTGYCDCDPGFTGLSCSEDLRECDVNNGGCEQICTDFLGGYNCSCMDGFRPQTNDESSCEDIDECVEDNGCDQTCVNTPGSYYCNCERGFQLINNTECDDVNECNDMNGGCQHSCTNTFGSYICRCDPGYLHLEDNSTSVGKCALPLLLECVTSNSTAHVTIDCKTNRPPQNILCSFNNGLQHRCSYPVTINRDVSPLGNYSLTISVEDDEGFQTETTVHYFLEDDTKPTVPAVVPPLLVSFINDSPRVMRDSVEADVLLSRPVQSLVCRLKRDRVQVDEVDCSSGHAVFSSLVPGVYTLRVVATNRHLDKGFIKRRFEVTTDAERCTLHLINDGVTVTGDSATVEFTGRGPVKDYRCQLDMMEFYECSSPEMLYGLSTGKHILKVVPSECGKNKMNLKTEIIIV